MNWSALVACSAAAFACTKKETTKTDVTPVAKQDATSPIDAVAAAPMGPPAFDPATRAKEILDRQIAALKQPADRYDSNLLVTFDPDTVLLAVDPRPVKEIDRGFSDAITRRAPHAEVEDVSYGELLAGGNENALWFTAVLTIKQDKTTKLTRVTELATAEASWKVVAGAFTGPSKPSAGSEEPHAFANQTDAGPLTPLFTDPARLADALADDPSVVVFGFDQRLTGAAAKQFVRELPMMTVNGKPREVRGKGWGYSVAQLSYEGGRKYPLRVAALLIAVPDGKGNWRVVSLHYSD